MAEATARTRPSRARTTTKPAEKSAEAPATTSGPVQTVTRFTVALENLGDTKSYTKFAVPDNYKGTVVGSIYAPIGTKAIKVLIVGPDDTETTE